ncbi:hypothetical protein ACTQ33_00140 [Candidatus Avoscillospira sp. LCP25S3_F1]
MNFLLFWPERKHESLINVKYTVIKEPDAQTQSR